jgi:hypothetical protein
MKSKEIQVTPAMAEKFLENQAPNRTLNNADVERYIRDMKSGRWRITGEPIKFDKRGRLMDGQHRLWACFLSGVTITVLSVTELEEDVMPLLDSGHSRSLADSLVIKHPRKFDRKKRTATNASAAIRYLIPYASLAGFTSRSRQEQQDLVLADPDLLDAVAFAQGFMKPDSGDLQPALVIALYYLSIIAKKTTAMETYLTQLRDTNLNDKATPAHRTHDFIKANLPLSSGTRTESGRWLKFRAVLHGFNLYEAFGQNGRVPRFNFPVDSNVVLDGAAPGDVGERLGEEAVAPKGKAAAA